MSSADRAELSVASRDLACEIAARRFGIDEPDLEVGRATHGAPEFRPDVGLAVSLSHSGGLIASAVAIDLIGVDVQQRRTVRSGLVDRFFAAAIPDAALRRACDPIVLWSSAESAAKASGIGLLRFLATHRMVAGADGWITEGPAVDGSASRGFTRVLHDGGGFVVTVATCQPMSDFTVEISA